MFDTHCHLNFHSFKNNLKDVIARATDVGVTHITIPSTDVETSIDAVAIAQNNENIYSAVGIHPHHIFKYQTEKNNEDKETFISNELEKIIKLTKKDKVVAIGEIGLDRHYYSKTKYSDYQIDEEFLSLQKAFFIKQVEIAANNNKSLILHNREASSEFLKILNDIWRDDFKERVVFHCCEPNKNLLEFAKTKKIFIGVDGDVTYNKEKEDFIKEIPIDKLVLETDSPFLIPEPIRSNKKFPNEPKNLNLIAEFIAEKLSIAALELKKITFENSKRLFNLT